MCIMLPMLSWDVTRYDINISLTFVLSYLYMYLLQRSVTFENLKNGKKEKKGNAEVGFDEY